MNDRFDRTVTRGSRTTVRGLLLGVALLTMAVLAACGTDDTGSGATEPTTKTSPEAANLKGSYELMLIAPLSTGGSQTTQPLPELEVAAQAAANTINADGGVNGRKVVIQVCDSQGNPSKSVACAQKAVKQKLPAVVGAFDAAGDYLAPLEKAGVPAIAPVAVGAENVSKAAFSVISGLRAYAGTFALLARQGVKDVAFAVPTAASSKMGSIYAIGREIFGLKITEVPVEPDVADWAPVVAQSAKHDAVISGLFVNQAIPYVQALRAGGYDGKVATDTGTMDDDALERLGGAGEGMYLSGMLLPASYTRSPDVKAYVDAMNALDPKAKKNDLSQNAYVAVRLFAKVAEGMPDVSAQALMKKLESSAAIDIGLLPPIDFTKQAPTTTKLFPELPRLFVSTAVFEQVKDGVPQPLTGEYDEVFAR